MTPEKRDAFIDRAMEYAKKELLRNGRLLPMFYGFTVEEADVLVAAQWPNDSKKMEILDGIRLLFAANGVRAYALVTEAWVISTDDEGKKKFDAWRRGERDRTGEWPSFEDYEGREEAINIFYKSHVDTKIVSVTIERGSDGKPSGFRDRPLADGKVSGVMLELLPPLDCPRLPDRDRDLINRAAECLGFRRVK